jgi:hypothetical protein
VQQCPVISQFGITSFGMITIDDVDRCPMSSKCTRSSILTRKGSVSIRFRNVHDFILNCGTQQASYVSDIQFIVIVMMRKMCMRNV